MTPGQAQFLEPEVPIEFGGKSRIIRVDFNTLALIEERTGKSVMQMGDWRGLKTKDLVSIVWACLVHEDQALTEKEVGKWLTFQNMATVMKAFATAMHISMKGERPTDEALEAVSPLEPIPFPIPVPKA